VSALAIVARGPFEVDVWACIVAEMRSRGIEEGDGAGDASVFEVEGGGVFEWFAAGMEGGAALHCGCCGR
jgi:hypothetical protein